nr:PREDICTED: zinc finger MYM-type protein 1-like [Latimeria chalumnae]|eukprot:XP_014353666.1 PREDICTED: zinc finger MYM-type protein 1-like [Latimeria chalumnae]
MDKFVRQKKIASDCSPTLCARDKIAADEQKEPSNAKKSAAANTCCWPLEPATAPSENENSSRENSEASGKSTTEGAKAHHNRQHNRSYQSNWKNKFNWISYDTIKDKVFCDTCCSANRMQLPLPATSRDSESYTAFVKEGFSNWKKAIERFGTHEKSNLHRAAVSSLGAVKAGVNVAAACSEAKQMKEARSALIKILSSVQYLSCQGLSVQGHTDKESNLNQLLALRAEDTPDLKSWLNRTKYRWISHDIVNEMIEIVAHDVLRTLMKEIHKAGFFSIIMDETADISVREQVSICFHIVNKNLDTEEIFFGFYNTSDTTSQALYTLLKDVLLRFDFPLKVQGTML